MAGLDVVDWSDEPSYVHDLDDCESARTIDPFDFMPSADTSLAADCIALDTAAPTGCDIPLIAGANHAEERVLHVDCAFMPTADTNDGALIAASASTPRPNLQQRSMR